MQRSIRIKGLSRSSIKWHDITSISVPKNHGGHVGPFPCFFFFFFFFFYCLFSCCCCCGWSDDVSSFLDKHIDVAYKQHTSISTTFGFHSSWRLSKKKKKKLRIFHIKGTTHLYSSSKESSVFSIRFPSYLPSFSPEHVRNAPHNNHSAHNTTTMKQ